MPLPFKIIIILFFTVSIKAQVIGTGPEAINWHFGENSFIKFDLSGGTIKSGFSPLSTEEGSACLSDKLGNLLFYCSGQTVWNRNNQIMKGGSDLFGGRSSTQAALIIQQPGENDKFYIFNTGDHGTNLYYSVVDLKGDGGLGEVVSANNILFNDVGEKLTACYAQNGFDIWIVVKDKLTHNFLSFLIDSRGIGETPVVSYNDLGFDLSDKTCAMGYLKFSPDGKYLASATFCKGQFELYDFDNFTGIVSAPKVVYIDSGLNAYGLSFSPDSRLLYVSAYNFDAYLYQFDVSSTNIDEIISSKNIIAHFNDGFSIGAIQQGPDNRLYLSRYKNKYLSVVNNPNLRGSSCGFREDGVFLNGSRTRLGLPNFAFVNYYSDYVPNPEKHDVYIWSEGFSASPSDEKSIKILVQTLKDSLKRDNLNLSFDIVFEAQSFSPLSSESIFKNVIDERYRRLSIYKENIHIDTGKSIVIEVPGIVLFGDKSKYEIRIENVLWSDTSIRTFTKFGTMNIHEICQTNLRRIIFARNNISMAPNPVDNNLNISFIADQSGYYTINVFDLTSRLIKSEILNVIQINEKVIKIFDTSDWPNGNLFIQLCFDGKCKDSEMFTKIR